MADLDLRYPIGPFALPPELGADDRIAAIDAIALTPAALRTAVSSLSRQQLDTPYRPDGWTVRQVVHHVPDSHLNAYIRMKLTVTENEPTINTYDQDRWALFADNEVDIDTSLVLLEALHTRWVRFLRALPDDDWSRQLHHPEIGKIRLDQLLALYGWHGAHHVAHITRLRDRNGWG